MFSRLVIIMIYLTSICFGEENWLDNVQNRTDADAVEWLREQLSSELISKLTQIDLDQLIGDQCSSCGSFLEVSPQVLVFMSFSVPDEAWMQLSHELQKHQEGVIVLRGLPNNSFQALAKKLIQLKNKGLNVDVRIDSKLFKKYEIEHVPAFVYLDNDEQSEIASKSTSAAKISGNISLKYFLDKVGKDRYQTQGSKVDPNPSTPVSKEAKHKTIALNNRSHSLNNTIFPNLKTVRPEAERIFP